MEIQNKKRLWDVKFMGMGVCSRTYYCQIDQVLEEVIGDGFNPDDILLITIQGL